MTNYLDDEVEHLLAAYHESAHALAILEAERIEVGLLDEISIDDDAGETVWYTNDEIPIDPKLQTAIAVAGMAAGKVMMPSVEWWAGAEEDMEKAVATSGEAGMKKTFQVVVREFKKSKQKARLLAVTMLLLDKGKIYREDVLKVLGEA